MPDIVIPEAIFEQFLRSLFVKVTQTQQELIAEYRADVEASEALFHVRLEEALVRRTRAHEAEHEKRLRAAEGRIELIIRAAEDQIARRRRAAEDEIARLRQQERQRYAAAAERGERPQ